MIAKAGRSHDEVVVEMLRADPEFAEAYLAAALEEAEQPGGGHQAMLTALRHIAEAQGMANVAEKGHATRVALPCAWASRQPHHQNSARLFKCVGASLVCG